MKTIGVPMGEEGLPKMNQKIIIGLCNTLEALHTHTI